MCTNNKIDLERDTEDYHSIRKWLGSQTAKVTASCSSSAAQVFQMEVGNVSGSPGVESVMELLLAAPVSLVAIVVGKFTGLMAYLSLMLVLIVAMPLSLRLFTPLDLGLLASGAIGLWLVMAAFTASCKSSVAI